MANGIYHIQDPLENFKIRIVLREISRPSADNAGGSKPFDDVITVRWQEKLYGPRDIADYLMYKRSSHGLPSQLDCRRHLSQVEKSGTDVTSLLSEVMLYTYMSEEPFYPEKRRILDSGDTRETYLSYAQDPVSDASKTDDRLVKVVDRLNRERQATSMHVCLATDVDPKALKDNTARAISDLSEVTLLTLTISKSGLLVASPPFSQILPEGTRAGVGADGLSDLTTAPSVFFDDETVQAGVRHGFKLSTCRVRAKSGAEYEYSIENVNGVISPVEMEDLLAAERREDAVLAENSRGGIVKNSEAEKAWQQTTVSESYTQSSTIYAEIVSGTGFGDGDPVYVKYQVVLPISWAMRSSGEGDEKEQDGEECKGDQQRLLPDEYCHTTGAAFDGNEPRLWGFTQLSAVTHHSPARRTRILPQKGQEPGANVKVSLPRVPPMMLEGDSYGRFLYGTIFMSLTALSVLLGPGYPLWVVVVVVLVAYLGYGVPGGCPQTVVCQTSTPHNSFGHGAEGACSLIGETVAENMAGFGHLFSVDVLVDENSCDEGSAAPSAHQMTVYFEVFSVSQYKRHTLEGCGYVHVPHSSKGTVDVDVSTWKPVGDLSSTLTDFFVGGGAHLSNIRYTEIPNKKSSALSKFGARTVSSGVIRFRYNVVSYSPARAVAYSDSDALGSKGATTARRTVEDILSSYRNTDLLLRSGSKQLLHSQGTPRARASRKDGGDDTTIAVDKVAELIARARASTESAKKESSGPLSSGSREKGGRSGIAMTAGGKNSPVRDGVSLLPDDMDAEDKNHPSASLLDRFESAGITQARAPIPHRTADTTSSPMHTTPVRRNRYDNDDSGDS